MPYTAFDMIRAMQHEYLLEPPEAQPERGSLYRFISALNGFFHR